MSRKTPPGNAAESAPTAPARSKGNGRSSDVPRKLSTGFALMALVPILLALYLFAGPGQLPASLTGPDGIVFTLMIASALAGFYFIKAELSRTFGSILDQAERRATDRFESSLREASRDEIGRIGETIERITSSLEDRSEEAELAKNRMRSGIGKVSHALQTARAEEELLQLLVEGVVETSDARVAWLVGVDEEEGDFVTRAAAGERADMFRGRRTPLGEGIPGLAARERRPLLVQDREGGDDGTLLAANERQPGTTMAAPLLQGETLHAVLIVSDRRDGGTFGPDDLDVLANLTNLAAVALGQWAAQARLQRDLDAVILAFARGVENRDPYARGRAERVARYCEAMAKSLRLDAETIRTVRRAALLHEIGKITLPDSLLKKEVAFTEEELEHVRNYPLTGEKLLSTVPGLGVVCPMIRHHNERVDGSGYPDGLAGDSIPLTTHLLILAHAFDAMTSDRSFRQAMPVPKALERVQQGAGTLYDRRAVQALVGLGGSGLKATDDVTSERGAVKGQGTASISVKD